MLEDITLIDLKILSLFIRDYAGTYSIRDMTKKLDINYPNAFKRVKLLAKRRILLEKKRGRSIIFHSIWPTLTPCSCSRL